MDARRARALPIASHLSLLARATVGGSTRDATIPIHYRFFLGSLTPSALLPERSTAVLEVNIGYMF